MKICSKCHIKKKLCCFGKRMSEKDGLYPWCKDCVKLQNYHYKLIHKTEVNNYTRLWILNHKEHRKIYRQNRKNTRNILLKTRRCVDLNFKLACSLRTRLTMALKGNQKSGSAVRDLGCAVEDLKLWLEQQFQPGMSWDNYGNGNGKWNIDHIIPVSKVDLAKREQLKKVCHWFNLRPMWSLDNISKSNHTTGE